MTSGRTDGGRARALAAVDAAVLRVVAERVVHHPCARLAGLLLTALAFAVLGLQLQRSIDLLRDEIGAPDLPRLGLSLVVLLGAYAAQACAWRGLANAAGARLTWPGAFGVLYLAQVGKYLPGAIWGYLSAFHWGLRAGIPPAGTTYAQVGLIVAESATAMALGGIALTWILGGVAPAALLAGAMLGGVAWVGVRLGLRWLGQVCYGGQLPTRAIAALFGWIVLHWLAFVGGYWLLLGTLWPVTVADAALAAALHAVAWLVGYWTLVVPGGLGVRELVHATLLASVLPTPIALVAPLLTRLWLTLGDGLACALAAGIALDRRAARRGTGAHT